MDKLNVCIDFDGVINNYNGWQGEDYLYEPQNNVEYFLQKISKKYNIIIFTTRDKEKVYGWLHKYDLNKYISQVTNTKIGAVAYIDDRSLQYKGDYEETLKELHDFKPYWEGEWRK